MRSSKKVLPWQQQGIQVVVFCALHTGRIVGLYCSQSRIDCSQGRIDCSQSRIDCSQSRIDCTLCLQYCL